MNEEQQQRITEALENLVEAIDDPEARVMVVAEIPQENSLQGDVMGEIVTANFDCSVCMVNMLAAAIVQINDSRHEENEQSTPHLH